MTATFTFTQRTEPRPPKPDDFHLCETSGWERSPEAIEYTFGLLRRNQIEAQHPSKPYAKIDKMYAASTARARGWAADGTSVVITVRKGAREDPLDFRASMGHLADRVDSVLVEESIVVSFGTTGGAPSQRPRSRT